MEIITRYKKAAQYLKMGKIGIIPTDTLYGLSCLTNSPTSIEKIYNIKQRDRDKPFIVLISSVEELKELGVSPSEIQKNTFTKYWPGPVSIILDVKSKKLDYLHRGFKSLAFRLPNEKNLLNILKETGPLVSTSANISDKPAISNSKDAVKIFNGKVDFMLNAGPLKDKNPSRIILLKDGVEKIIR